MRTAAALGSTVIFLGFLCLGVRAAGETGKPIVTLAATVDVTDETTAKPGIVTAARSGDASAPLQVQVDIQGSAKAGVDYREIPRSLTIPAGESSAAIAITAIGDFDKQAVRTVVVNLKSDSGYTNGQPATATISINDSPPELFVAALRPVADAPESTAYGTAALLLAPDHLRARVTVSHANLTSPLVTSHLKLGDPGNEGSYLVNFPANQNASFDWAMQPTGQFTEAALRSALDSGLVYVALDSKNHPAGELRGNFIHATGSEKFQAPAPPPNRPAAPLTPRDVARFLMQATFGPKKSEIDDFLHPPGQPNQPPPQPRNFNAWISEQMAIPASSHLEATRADYRMMPPPAPPAAPAVAKPVATTPAPILPAASTPAPATPAATAAAAMMTETTAPMAGAAAAPVTSPIPAQTAPATTPSVAAAAPAVVPQKPRLSNANRENAWWQVALTAPDQLRQRVAFALSEIFVVSDVHQALSNNPEASAAYYDMLARDAFGNFRQLLEDVTLSPIMGAYLSALQSAKADEARGTSADENYAREVMQLFTIGLNELQPDGTYRLGKDGRTIATYDQGTVMETAKVFTGWGFYSPEPQASFAGARSNFFEAMMLYPAQHDDGPKTIVGGVKIPPKQGGIGDLRQTLDTLFNHPNTGPFICRQLIQRLVTSNPSPGYVYRVSQVFARNSRGVRGDLGAVIRAILLDYEARSPDVLGNFGYGKMKEPLLQATALLRAFDASTPGGRWFFPNPEGTLGQAALRSPTVFNFFEPDYVLPGPLAAAGLRAPEYQILTDTTAISIPNQLRNLIYTPAKPGENTWVLKLEPLVPVFHQSLDSLIDNLDLVFCAGALPSQARKVISDTIATVPANMVDIDRIRTVLELVVTSPEAAVQR